jgi:pyruvate,water dikinase
MELTGLLEKVEAYYQKPVDIEWAISEGKLYLLQVRPITTYLPLPEEMITAPGAPKQLYADATLIEQGLQEPLSVLGTDFLAYVLREMTGLIGGDVIGIDGIAFTSGGRYYLQLSNSIKLMGTNSPLAPGSLGDTSVMEILDNLDLTLYTPRTLPKRLRTTKSSMLLRMPLLIMSSLKTFRDPDAFMRKYKEAYPRQLQRLEEIKKQELTLHELAVRLNSIVHFFSVDYGVPMFMIPQFVELRLKAIFKKESERVKDALVSLGISLPGNKPAEMGQLMYKLASFEEIKTSRSADEFVQRLYKRTLDPALLKVWDQYMDEFGFRCPGEIDVSIARPNEKPELLYEQLKDISQAIISRKGSRTIFEEAKAKREAAYQSLRELAFQKGKGTGKAFEACYRVLLSFGGHGKETSKHHIVMVMDVFRKRALQVAQTFVKAGRLDDPDQIFNLTIDDIDRAVKQPALDLRVLARERTVLLNKIKRIHLIARVIDSRGKVFSPPQKEAKQGELTGVPISPGIVQGKVKVLHQVDEKKLLPGEILVARSTDPGWTPLFINAGGIILEIGGALQHGAIIAREYGIPCVSGLDDATSLLADGQLIEVDGSNGIIRLLK